MAPSGAVLAIFFVPNQQLNGSGPQCNARMSLSQKKDAKFFVKTKDAGLLNPQDDLAAHSSVPLKTNTSEKLLFLVLHFLLKHFHFKLK